MQIEWQNEKGTVFITHKVIGTIIGTAVSTVMGVVGMTPKTLKDGIHEILKRGSFQKGVYISGDNGEINVDIHIIAKYGTKLSEVASNVQKITRFELENTMGIQVNHVNVYIESVLT